MMSDQVFCFVEGLIDKTRRKELIWKPLALFENKNELYNELKNTSIDLGMNTIREHYSYYLESGEGFVFLFDICHGDDEICSPELDAIRLMVKINRYLTIDDLSINGEEEQGQLEVLKLLIESGIEEKYSYPDVLYKFMDQVLTNETN